MTERLCANCVHYRSRRDPVDGLRADLGGDLAVDAADTQLRDGLNRLYGAEAKEKIRAEQQETIHWAHRPRMSAFCGFDEDKGVYYIAELKNRGGQCNDYCAGQPPANTCVTCADHIPGTGLATDLLIERTAEEAIQRAKLAGGSPPSPLHRDTTSAKISEIRAAVSGQGQLPYRPTYVSYCRLFSDPQNNRYAVCALVNQHNSCPAWRLD